MVDTRRPGDPVPPPIERPILRSAVIYGAQNRRGAFNMPSGSGTRPVPFIPQLDPIGQITPSRANDASTHPSENQTMYIAQDDVIPILYGGPEMLSGLLYFYGVYGTLYTACMILCEGEIELIGNTGTSDGDTDMTGVLNGDVAAIAGAVQIYKYRGTNTQNIDSRLQAIVPSFDENMRGTAYYVVQAVPGTTGVPRITVPVKGRKIFDPRCNLLTQSNNFGDANWGKSNIASVVQDAVGPYGATNYAWTATDSSGSTGIIYQNITGLVNNSASYVGCVKVAKRTGAPQFGFDLSLSGGTPTVAVSARIMPETGDTTGSSAGVVAVDLGTHWKLSISITNNSSGNTTLQMAIYPCALNGAATGYNVISEAYVRHEVRPDGYLDTTTVAMDQPTVFSKNTGLILGDYLASTVYGEGRVVNQQSLATAAEFCDQVLGTVRTGTYTWSANTVTVTTTDPHGLIAGLSLTTFDFTSGAATPDGQYTIISVPSPYTFTFTLTGSGAGGNVSFWNSAQNERRSTLTLMVDEIRPKSEWRDIIRSYIPAWVNDGGDEAFIRVDTVGSVDHTFTDSDIDVTESIPQFNRAGVNQSPNVVTIKYTDTSLYPWKTATATAPDTIPTDARRSGIDMLGMRSYAQAKRYAIEKLNHYTIEDLTGEIDIFDIGLKVFPGDIVSVTYTLLNISAKLFRVLGVQDRGHGRWRLRLREYQPNTYSNAVQSAPALSDLTPPNINNIPTVSGLTLTEFRRQESGVWVSRIAVTWNPITNWPYVRGYVIGHYGPVSGSVAYTVPSSTTISVNRTAHGLVAGNRAYLNFTSGSGLTHSDEYDVISVTDANNFVVLVTGWTPTTGGNCTVRNSIDGSGFSRTTVYYTEPILLGQDYIITVRVMAVGSQNVGAATVSSPITFNANSSYGGSTQLTLYISSTEPPTKAHGLEWFNPDTGRKYMWYVGVSSSAWIEVY